MELVWKQAIREAGGVGSILKEVDVPATFQNALEATCGKTVEKSVDKNFKALADGVIQKSFKEAVPKLIAKSVNQTLEQAFQGKSVDETMQKSIQAALEKTLDSEAAQKCIWRQITRIVGGIDLSKPSTGIKKKPLLKKKKKTGAAAPPGAGSYLQDLLHNRV
eukprot:2153464-Rhodomonas_salina.1